MRKKLIIKKTGEIVEMGDVISITYKRTESDSSITSSITTTVTPENVKLFIENGILEEVKSSKDSTINTTVEYYLEILAKTLCKSTKETLNLFKSLKGIDPLIEIRLLLKVIAQEMLKKDGYKRISQYKGALWYIDTFDGSIRLLPSILDNTKVIGSLSLFGSRENALKAKSILKAQFAEIYDRKN